MQTTLLPVRRAPAVTARRRGRPTAAPGLAAGYAADLALGDPARWHPVAGFGAAASKLERALWRPSRPAGAVYTAALVGAAALLGRRVPLAALTWTALGGRSLGRVATALADAVAAGDIDEARRILPSLAGRDPSRLDANELCRAAIESVAENTADAVVGPLVWGALAGSAGVAVYRAANTLDAMVGHRNERYERFGWASARLDDVLTWPAARLTALLAVALGPDRGSAMRVLRRDGSSHPSPNAGRCEAAFAGALGVRLGGTNVYGERVEERPHLGDGKPPGAGDVRRAVRLSQAVGAAAAALCVAVAWAVRR